MRRCWRSCGPGYMRANCPTTASFDATARELHRHTACVTRTLYVAATRPATAELSLPDAKSRVLRPAADLEIVRTCRHGQRLSALLLRVAGRRGIAGRTRPLEADRVRRERSAAKLIPVRDLDRPDIVCAGAILHDRDEHDPIAGRDHVPSTEHFLPSAASGSRGSGGINAHGGTDDSLVGAHASGCSRGTSWTHRAHRAGGTSWTCRTSRTGGTHGTCRTCRSNGTRRASRSGRPRNSVRTGRTCRAD